MTIHRWHHYLAHLHLFTSLTSLMAVSNPTHRRASAGRVGVKGQSSYFTMVICTFMCVTLLAEHVDLVQEEHHWCGVKRCSHRT